MAGVNEFSANELLNGDGIILPDVADLSSVNLAGLAAPQLQALVLPRVLRSTPNEEKNPDLDGDGFISASELMEAFPNLSLSAIGVMLLTDLMSNKMKTQLDTIDLLRRTSKKMRHDHIVATKASEESIKRIPDNNNVGISPSGKPNQDAGDMSKPWWYWLVGGLVAAIAAIAAVAACIFTGGAAIPAVLGIMTILALTAVIIQTAINSGSDKINKKAAKIALMCLAPLNPISFLIDGITEAVVSAEVKGKSKEEAEEIRRKAELIKALVTLAVQIALAPLSSGGVGIVAAVFEVIEALASMAMAVVSIVNGIFMYMKGKEAEKTAESVFEYQQIMNVVETQKTMLHNLMLTIDDMIQRLGDDAKILTAEFMRASDLIKIENETNVGIARNIVI